MKNIVSQLIKIAKILLSSKKIQIDQNTKNIYELLKKQLEKGEPISLNFQYVNKQGQKKKFTNFKLLRLQKKFGNNVMIGKLGFSDKQYSLSLNSVISGDNQIQEQKKKVIVLDDDCDFQKQLKKAIEEGYDVKFNYNLQSGKVWKVLFTPKQLKNTSYGLVCVGDTNLGQRILSLSSMGKKEGKDDIYKKYPWMKNNFYCQHPIEGLKMFRPIRMKDQNTVILQGVDYKGYHYKQVVDGDYDDGGRGNWQTIQRGIKYYPKKPNGHQYQGQLVGETIKYKGKKLHILYKGGCVMEPEQRQTIDVPDYRRW